MPEQPTRARRVMSVTPMKNEGPFILEWVAYHRLIGINDMLVFTNDCTDGSDLMLDRLDELGYLRHYGNPSMITGTDRHHWTVLNYFNTLSRPRRADWIVSFDVDEFICVNAGDGTLEALFAACEGADVISFNQLNFGCAGQRHYAEDLQIDRFDRAQNYTGFMGKRANRRGVKSLTRVGAPVERITNHSPRPLADRAGELVWVNAANRRLPDDLTVREVKSLPEGLYDYTLVQLNHYATRSMDSFLTQVARGNANHPEGNADVDYWRRYNINQQHETRIQRWSGRVRAEIERMLEDPELAELQAATIAHHRDQIAQLLDNKAFLGLRRRIENAHVRGWEQQPEQV